MCKFLMVTDMKNKVVFLTVLLLIIMSLTACGKNKVHNGQEKYLVYCLDRNENTLHSFEWYSNAESMGLISELMDQMTLVPEDVNLREAIRGFEIIDCSISDGQIFLDVSDEYRSMTPTTEILVRAAIVRTLCQVDGIDYVSMKCHGEDLQDALGQTVGLMNPSVFVDNEGNEVNSYERVQLMLYYATADGTALRKELRTVEYISNISMEKLVVEQLIKGTDVEGTMATINPLTMIVNVTQKDGICYVNLDEGILSLQENVSPELTVFSIVNSLSELPGVNKVEISINGRTDVMLGDGYSLNTMFERNLDLVENE